MCVTFIRETIENPTEISHLGFKLFSVIDDKLYPVFAPAIDWIDNPLKWAKEVKSKLLPLPINQWIEDPFDGIIGYGHNTYRTGFHVFREKTNAAMVKAATIAGPYREVSLFNVEYKAVVATGKQNFDVLIGHQSMSVDYEVIVARKMKIWAK